MVYPNQQPRPPGYKSPPSMMGNLGRPSPPMRMRANTMQMPSLANTRLRQPMPKRGSPSMNGLQLPQLPQLPQVPQPPQIPPMVGSGGRLDAAQRRNLPASSFAGPNRSFPIPDVGHATAALGMIDHAPASARPAIRARADAMLNRSAPKPGR